jgi:penicillin-binding protein 1C
MPLPRRVDQIDINATRVIPVRRGLPGATPPVSQTPTPAPTPTPTAQPATRPVQQNQYVSQQPTPPAQPPIANSQPVKRFPAGGTPQRPPAPPSKDGGSGRKPAKSGGMNSGCLLKGLIAALFVLVFGFILAGSFMVIEYYSIARSIPGIEDLKSHTSQFETTRILDRDGNVLYEILDPNAGRRTYTPLAKISPYMLAATIATEDKDFYNHPGFNLFAIARAMVQNYTSGEIESGASTITQQLARSLFFTQEERYEQTLKRKTREIVLAAEITRRYSKDEILELYLNENNYGNMTYGVEAAAETYFNTTADKLTLAQSAFLAGIPQAPAVYEINTNREATLGRNKQVLLLMMNTSKEDNCIYVSNSEQKVCVSESDVLTSVKEIEEYPFKPVNFEMTFPHWVNYIRAELEQMYDPQTIYRSGFTVYTTIDPELQKEAQQVVTDQVAQLADNNASDGALVAIRPSTGEILAMVGSADFNNETISGQVNMAVSPRQPGSSIKPLTYVAAFEKGWTPATLIWDVPSEFPPSGRADDTRDPYKPVNYDGNFHGPVTVRTALSNSFNVPAVKALNFVGIYDDPATPEKEGLIEFAKRMGITSLTSDQYGLSLTLGGGEVSVLQMTGAFSIFANGGNKVPPVSITKIVNASGETVYEYKQPKTDQVVRAEHAYLISSILSDQDARVPMFGENPVINLPFTAAVKTGTTNDFRDNWTVGYTPDLAVGVWVGNADNTPMQNTTGLTGAAPIWAEVMKYGIDRYTNNDPTPFNKPDTIVRKVICAVSGTEPSEWCPDTRKEYFAPDQLPLPKEKDLWQNSKLDTWTGLIASDACGDFTKEVFTINVQDAAARKWLKQSDAGKAWMKANKFKKPYTFTPDRACKEDDPHPTLKFVGLDDNQKITDKQLEISIQAYGGGFKNVSLDYGEGSDPEEWTNLVSESTDQYKDPDKFYLWDLETLPAGVVTLRLTMTNNSDGYAEKLIHLDLQVPTPTPTNTPTATSTSMPTETPTSTPVPPTEPPTAVPPTETPPPPVVTDTITP